MKMSKEDLDLYLKMIEKQKLNYLLDQKHNKKLLEDMALTAIQRYHEQFLTNERN